MPHPDAAQWATTVDLRRGRRSIAGVPVSVLSQHFARLHHTIVTASAIDGQAVLRAAARAAFAPLLARTVTTHCATEALAGCVDLFATLGLGRLQSTTSGFDAPSAHAAHAWVAAFGPATVPVCALTEGFLEAVHAAIGRPGEIREVECIAAGAPRCRFDIIGAGAPEAGADRAPHGDGLHTAFGQSVATLPASLLGLLGHGFLAAMDAKGQLGIAYDLLAYDSEEAVLCMFAGVLRSREWIDRYGERREGAAVLEALLEVARELGWGPWRLESFAASPCVRLSAPPPPPSLGGRHDPSVALARGAAAGLCELVLCEGALDERFGALQVSATVGEGAMDIVVDADEAGWIPGGLAA